MMCIGLFLLVGGVAENENRLVLASVPLIGYVVISLYFSNTRTSEVFVQRLIERKSLYEGEWFLVTIELHNRGSTDIEFLEVVDVIPSGMSVVSGFNHRVLQLKIGESHAFSYSLVSKTYGEFTIGPLRIRTSDIQNSISILKIYEDLTYLRIFPKVGYLPRMTIKPKTTKSWPGEILAKQNGNGLEFFGLADYVLGDPVKRINWKASSRFGDKLYTNQFMGELGGDTVIVMDARSVSQIGRTPLSTIDYSVRAAAAVSYRLLRDRNRVGLVIAGPSLTKVLPGFGRRQYNRILASISATKPSSIWEIRALGRYVSTFFSRAVQIIFISPLVDDGAVTSVMDIASQGYRILVISPSHLDAEQISITRKSREYELGWRLAKLKRDNTLALLRQKIPVIDWRITSPLSEAVRNPTWERSRSR